jgi:hypothetical protein
LLLASCIAVPIPWFPKNPHAEEIIGFLDEEAVDREEVVARLGQPWANLGLRSFVYLADKRSAYVLVAAYGGSGGEIPINRDYFLVIDFDTDGEVVNYETYADSLRHDYCFQNQVCLERETFNVPVAPPAFDLEAKKFEAVADKCVIYVYRDHEGRGLSENSYVNISVGIDGNPMRRLATSVEHGFHRFEFPPTMRLEIRFSLPEYPDVNEEGWFDNDPATERRTSKTTLLPCAAGEVAFYRLYVPEKNSRPMEFDGVHPVIAEAKISRMKLLLERRLLLTSELESGILE